MSDGTERWRFLDSGPGCGKYNMAVDLAITQQAGRQPFAATLRVYSWQPAAVSLGYHQSLSDLDLEQCRRRGVDVVLRPTGGRAVLHCNELTYSVVLSSASRYFKTEIQAVYERLAQALLAGLSALHSAIVFDRAERTPQNFSRGELSSLCYASTVRHEIGFQGRKMVGSAQRRFENAILQHGSILMGPEHADLAFLLSRGDDAWRTAVQQHMLRHTVHLNEWTVEPIRYEQVAAALRLGFKQTLDIDWVDAPLSAVEEQDVEHSLHE